MAPVLTKTRRTPSQRGRRSFTFAMDRKRHGSTARRQVRRLRQQCIVRASEVAWKGQVVTIVTVIGKMAVETRSLKQITHSSVEYPGNIPFLLVLNCANAWFEDFTWVHDLLCLRNRLGAQQVAITGLAHTHQREILAQLAAADRPPWFTLPNRWFDLFEDEPS